MTDTAHRDDVPRRSATGPVLGGVVVGAVAGTVWSLACGLVVMVGALTETMDGGEVPAFKAWFVYGGLALLAVPVIVGLVLVAVRWRRPGFGLGAGLGLLVPLVVWLGLPALGAAAGLVLP